MEGTQPPTVKPVTRAYSRVSPPAAVPDGAPAAAPDPVVARQEAPSPGRLFPCEQCGAGLVYTPGSQDLRCPYCNHSKHIPQTLGEVQEYPFEHYVREGQVAQQVLGAVQGERRCDGCGAMVMICGSIATDECPFCGTHLTNPITTPQPMIQPAGVLPFAITDPQAREGFKKWVSSRWFAPNAFKKAADLGRVSGLYVPYWTYDAMTWSFYTGQRGTHYYVTVGSGKNRRRERRTSWTSTSGRVNHWFDDVLVCASKSVPPKLVRALEPWDFVGLQPYNDQFLSGFRSERYQVALDDGFVEARQIMDDYIRVLIKQDIGGDEQRIDTVRTQIDGVTFKHVLLPIWLSAYMYHGKTFRVLINARTGEVSGERPWSLVKITFAVLLALAVIVPIIVKIAANQ